MLRMGGKIRFANHSSKPNCKVKILVVAGDHRQEVWSDGVKVVQRIRDSEAISVECGQVRRRKEGDGMRLRARLLHQACEERIR